MPISIEPRKEGRKGGKVMVESYYHDRDEHSAGRQPLPAREHEQAMASGTASAGYDCSTRGACAGLSGANAGARASAMHDMQRTHGNRAVQRFLPSGPLLPPRLKEPTLEDRIMKAMQELVESGNEPSSGGGGAGGGGTQGSPANGGAQGGGLGGWLSGAASKAVEWVNQGTKRVSGAAGEVVSGPVGMHIPDITPPEPVSPPELPWTPWNPYMQPDPMPELPPVTPWNPYMPPDQDPFDSPWVIH
jgi:hypothetical protein